jgi:hypothetical protein
MVTGGPLYPPTGTSLQVTKATRNVTLGQIAYSSTIQAQGLDVLEFEIRVRNLTGSPVTITLRDIFPQELYYVNGSTFIDNVQVADGIISSGVSLATLNLNEERVIRFRAVVFSGVPYRTITNQAQAVSNGGVIQTGYATITIQNRGTVLGVSEIPTGPEDTLPFVLMIGFIGAVTSHMMFFKRGLSSLAHASDSSLDGYSEELEVRLAALRADEADLSRAPELL